MLPGTIIVIYWDHSGALFPSDVSRGCSPRAPRKLQEQHSHPQREQPQPRLQATLIPFFFFPAERNHGMVWDLRAHPIPSHPLSRDTFPIQPWTPAGVWQPQNSCPPEPPPASVSQVGMAPPQPFLRFSREKNSSSSALCQRLHFISLGKPHIFVQSCSCHYSI